MSRSSAQRESSSMSAHAVETYTSRLDYYRRRASRVKAEEIGDQEEVRREALDVFEEFRPARERANSLTEPSKE
jgi:hypothetical protein